MPQFDEKSELLVQVSLAHNNFKIVTAVVAANDRESAIKKTALQNRPHKVMNKTTNSPNTGRELRGKVNIIPVLFNSIDKRV